MRPTRFAAAATGVVLTVALAGPGHADHATRTTTVDRAKGHVSISFVGHGADYSLVGKVKHGANAKVKLLQAPKRKGHYAVVLKTHADGGGHYAFDHLSQGGWFRSSSKGHKSKPVSVVVAP